MSSKNNAKIIDAKSYADAGIGPDGKPIRAGQDMGNLMEKIAQNLRIMDEAMACNRFVWYNLPDGMTGQKLERMLWYKGTLMFFYSKALDEFYFLPYVLNGDEKTGQNLNVYGEYLSVSPLPFYGSAEASKEKKNIWIDELGPKEVIRDVLLDEESEDDIVDTMLNCCVLLYDYTPQLPQMPTPTQILHDPIINAMAEAYPLARTSLLAHSGIKGLRVPSEIDAPNVKNAAKGVVKAALNGEIWVPITGMQEFQDLADGGNATPEDFLLYMQSMENFLRSLYGLNNGGIFEKSERKLVDEQNMNAGIASLKLDDDLRQRQRFCDIVNSIWGLGIWCELSETALGADTDGDGVVSDEQDQSGSQEGEQPNEFNQ